MSRDVFSSDPREETGQETGYENQRADLGARQQSTRSEFAPSHPDARPAILPGPTNSRRAEELESPRAYSLGDRTYFLRDSELHTLAEVGMFRAIAGTDLGHFSYGGDTERMNREIRRLKSQSLLVEKVLPARHGKAVHLFALTRRGARLVRNSGRLPEQQSIYHGFVKPREARHDANLYRLYQAQIERITAAGGRPARVVLDYELKRDLNRELARLSAEEQSPEARARIAERHGLSVVNGKIPVPDLRIEYDTDDMVRRTLDLELATRNYRPRALAEKALAGFALCALREDASRLRRVLDEREITAEILSL